MTNKFGIRQDNALDSANITTKTTKTELWNYQVLPEVLEIEQSLDIDGLLRVILNLGAILVGDLASISPPLSHCQSP